MTQTDEDFLSKGVITARQGFEGPMARQNLITDSLVAHPIYPHQLRVWDAFQTGIATAGTDDLGVLAGAFGTGCPYVTAGDQNGVASSTRYARFSYQLPVSYASGNRVYLNFAAGILATSAVCLTSCTVDAEVYKVNRDGLKTGSDLVTTSATTMNSTTFADKPFVITPTGLIPGVILDVRIAIAAVHNTGTSSIPILAAIEMLLDVKG